MWWYVVATACTILGLAGDIVGAIIVARDYLAMTVTRAVETETVRADHVGLNNPRAREKLTQAADMKRAMICFGGGFALQAVGSIVGLIASLMNLRSATP